MLAEKAADLIRGPEPLDPVAAPLARLLGISEGAVRRLLRFDQPGRCCDAWAF